MLADPLDGLALRQESAADHQLARRQAPHIRFDAREPFMPAVVGYSIFRESAPSPSFPRDIRLDDGVALAIEYAVWWDWDIQHLYELEHIWVYLDADGRLIDAEASWHGDYNLMRDDTGELPQVDGRLTLFSEPGKHAFAASAERLLERRERTCGSCGVHAGKMGVHVTPLFDGAIGDKTPLNDRLVHTWLERQRFEPSFDFSCEFDLAGAAFVPWPHLGAWIPTRVSALLAELRATIPPHQRRALRIAHRGASAYAPENSAESLRLAAEMGADLVEIDIRVSADDVAVVTHDSGLKRLYGIDGAVSDYSVHELRRLTAGPGAISSVAEALDLCRGLGLGIYLDIKEFSRGAARSIFKALDTQHYWRQVIFGSGRADTLAHIRAARPDARTSILFNAVDLDPVLLARAIGADYVHPCWEHRAAEPHRLLTPEWIAAVRAADLGIVCWHEERPAEIAALKALGVDAICSDRPDLLLSTPAKVS